MTEEEFWRREYICPMCLIRQTMTEMFPKCCGHYMVEFEDWEKDKAAWLRSREYNLELERLAGLFDECYACRYGPCDTYPPVAVLEDEVRDAMEICGCGLANELCCWDKLSDEATEDFEKLVEESDPQALQGYIRQWESRANLYPDYVEHPVVWELTFWEKTRYWTFDDWKDWLMYNDS